MGFIDVVSGGTERTNGGWSWSTLLLPHLDQSAVYNQFNFNTTPYAVQTPGGTPVQNQALVGLPLNVFTCPSDARPRTAANNGNAVNVAAGQGTAAAAISSYMGVRGAFNGRTAPTMESAQCRRSPTILATTACWSPMSWHVPRRD